MLIDHRLAPRLAKFFAREISEVFTDCFDRIEVKMFVGESLFMIEVLCFFIISSRVIETRVELLLFIRSY